MNKVDLAFCKEKMVLGFVLSRDENGKIATLWTPLGIINTIQYTILVIDSLWALYKLIREIWRTYRNPPEELIQKWSKVAASDAKKNVT